MRARLEPTRHGAYVALLPSIFADIEDSDSAASQAMASLCAVLLELSLRSTMPLGEFITGADAALDPVRTTENSIRIQVQCGGECRHPPTLAGNLGTVYGP